MRFLPETIQYTRLAAGDIRRHQVEALRETLAYAGHRVPYWRDLFAELRFRPEDVSDVRHLEALPVLTKETIREQGSRLLSDEFASTTTLIRRQTGGSTGEPLTFYVDPPSHERQMAVLLRDFWRIGVGVGDMQAKLWGYGRDHLLLNVFAPLTRRLYLDATRSGESEMARWYSSMRRAKVEVIYGYASSVFAFSRYLGHRWLHLPSVRAVCVTAEKLHQQMREEISSAFPSALVVDMYGAHETVRLASECACGGMHIDTDAAVLEFVEDGTSGHEGKRILLTTLMNRAMPFIRYDLGDRGEPIAGRCSCGEGTPLMSLEVGKEHQVFDFWPGIAVHTTVFTKPLYQLAGVARFQVRRTGARSVDLLVVPTSDAPASLERDLEAIARRCSQAADHTASVIPRIVHRIPQTARGKHQLVVSGIDDGDPRRWAPGTGGPRSSKDGSHA